MSDLTFTCDTLSPPPVARPAKAVRVIRPSESRTPTYRPDDPDLHAATMALSGPLWNGPRPSEIQHVRNGGSQIHARFDNAQYDQGMRKHWAMADYLGPDAAANPGVRYLLRIRSRYEVANNSYARGIVTTLANDTIGRGPRLHMTTPDVDVNREVKAKFSQWAKEIDLAGKLRTMRMAKAQDGEGFCVQSNRNVTQASLDRGGSPVRLNLRIFEADQCATVSAMMFSVPSVDGIELDEHFQPKNYFILRIHPGNYVYLPGYVGFPWDYDTFPAAKVCHWYRKDRPELHRGIPELTPALNLFAQLRDYTNSILKSARIQSSWAISIETNAPAGLQEVAAVAPMDTFDFEDGMAMTMPAGWKASGLNPTFPDAKYPTFKRELLCEIGRCINMPLCVIAGDSSGYNYASGRLDFQVYRKSIEVDRSECEQAVLDKILQWWIDEATLIEGYLPQAARNLKADMSHQWLWDQEEHVDPTKESSAAETRLGTLTSNLAIEWQKNGVEWEEGLEQIARELAFKKNLEAKYGIQFPSPKNQGTPEKPEDDSEPVDDSQPGEEPDDSQEPTEAGRKAGTILARRRKTRKAIQAADSEPRDTGKWITTESGTHIHLDSSGHIDKGPPELVNKTLDHLSREAHRKSEKADESGKAADHEAARDSQKTAGDLHQAIGNHEKAHFHHGEAARHDSEARKSSSDAKNSDRPLDDNSTQSRIGKSDTGTSPESKTSQGDTHVDTAVQTPAAPKTDQEHVDVAKQRGIDVQRGGNAWLFSGDTLKHKDLLKQMGGRWDKAKQAWSLSPDSARRAIKKLASKGPGGVPPGHREFKRDTESSASPYAVGQKVQAPDKSWHVITQVDAPRRFTEGLSRGKRIDEGHSHRAIARPATEDEAREAEKALRVKQIKKELDGLSLGPDDERDAEKHAARVAQLRKDLEEAQKSSSDTKNSDRPLDRNSTESRIDHSEHGTSPEPKKPDQGESKVTDTKTQYGTGIPSSGAHDKAFYHEKIQPMVDALKEPEGGSDKQKSWAADLQYQWSQAMAKRLIGKENDASVDAYLAKVVKLANSKTETKWWIDHRGLDPVSIAKELGW